VLESLEYTKAGGLGFKRPNRRFSELAGEAACNQEYACGLE
jgi:hypothetical protein